MQGQPNPDAGSAGPSGGGIVVALAALAIAAVWIGSLWFGQSTGSADGSIGLFGERRPRFTEPFDFDFTLHRFADGMPVKWSELRGKVVFMNEWATWCGPCRQEKPSLQRLYDRYRDNPGIAFVFLSMDQNPDDIVTYLNQKKYTIPVYLPTGRLPQVFSPAGIPASYVVDKKGVLRERVNGARDWDSEEVKSRLDQLIALE